MELRALAARVAESTFAADRATREFMQIELVSCEPGRAVTHMAVVQGNVVQEVA